MALSVATIFLATVIFMFTGGPLLFMFVVWNSSFVHRCRIAIQTGDDPGDVIWKDDRFKVLMRDGHHYVVFKFTRGKASSPPGNFWTKFLIGKSTVVDFDKGVWLTKNLPNKIQRGLILYRTIDGQFHPVGLTKEGNLRVLTQDNRSFLIRSDRDAQKLLLTGKQQVVTLVAIVIGIIVLGLCFLFFLVYLGNNVATICGTAQTVAQNGVLAGATHVLGG